jgi:hypothetical protein
VLRRPPAPPEGTVMLPQQPEPEPPPAQEPPTRPGTTPIEDPPARLHTVGIRDASGGKPDRRPQRMRRCYR